MGGHCSPRLQPERYGDDWNRRQVRRVRRLLQVAERSVGPWIAGAQFKTAIELDRSRRTGNAATKATKRSSKITTEFSFPAALASAASKGMLIAIRYARENKVPYFGICLGMQTACVEFARNVVGLAEANSSEFDQATPHRVIYKLRELRGVEELGGTMRLGAWTCKIEPDTLAHKIYGKLEISERHRHRYEFNREYEEPLVAAGLRISGSTPDGTYVEMIELPDHPHFIGCQFHPEFKSKPLEPHPLFSTFVAAAYEHGAERRAEKEVAAVEMFHRPEKVARR